MIYYGINTEDISVVVQGAVDKKNTPLCLKSVRKHLPGAEIILSTWKGTDTHGLDYDQLVLSDDPGGVKDKKNKFVNNLNRQIVSTQSGLASSERTYCFKMRSDLVLTSNSFLKHMNLYPKRDKKRIFFKERVLFCSMFFKKYLGEVAHTVMPTPFHISDWLMFGLREDIMKLFDISPAKEPENTDYFYNNKPRTIRPYYFGALHQYAPEQYILYRSLKKHLPNKDVVEFDNILSFSGENIKYYEEFVASNCIILNPYQIKIYCAKDNGMDPYKAWTLNYLSLPYFVFEGLYSHEVFLEDYIKYCDENYMIPSSVKIRKFFYCMLNKYFEKRV